MEAQNKPQKLPFPLLPEGGNRMTEGTAQKHTPHLLGLGVHGRAGLKGVAAQQEKG